MAITLCELILSYHPNYHDARLIIARIHSWNRDFEKSKQQTQIVLDNPSQRYTFNFRKNVTQRWLVKFDAQYEQQKLFSSAVKKNLII